MFNKVEREKMNRISEEISEEHQFSLSNFERHKTQPVETATVTIPIVFQGDINEINKREILCRIRVFLRYRIAEIDQRLDIDLSEELRCKDWCKYLREAQKNLKNSNPV